MEVTVKKFCKPCGDDTKRVPANGLCLECEEHMCIACFGNHKKYKMCKDHSMVDIHAKIPDISNTKEDNFEKCKHHKNENIKFYCSAHEETGCGDCIILEHKTCKIEYIRDISNDFKDSKELKDVVKRVDSYQKKVHKCSSSINNNKIQAEDMYQGFLAEVKSFRDEINTRLDKLEEELVQKANDAKTTDTLLIESLIVPCEELAKDISQIRDNIASKSDEPNKLFVSAKQCTRAIREIEQKLCTIMSDNRITNYSFERNTKIEELLEQVEIGTVHAMHEENTSEMDSQDYEEPISSQAKLKNNGTIFEDNISIPDSQAYDEVFYEDIPVRDTSHKRRSTRRPYSLNSDSNSLMSNNHFTLPLTSSIVCLFGNQLRCENLLMAGEYLSFNDIRQGDIGLFIGKKAIKAGAYFEVEVINSDEKGNIAVGLVPKDNSLKEQPGDGRFSIGYHAKDGCIHDQNASVERVSPPSKVGDVIGIGVSSYLTNVFKTKIDIFFTRNRQKIRVLEINNPPFCKVYPAVGLKASGDKARVILDAKEP